VDEAFAALHPSVAAWCDEHLRVATPPQREAIPLALARRNVLVCSPTGTGKTLAAFLPAMSALAARRDRDELFARPYVLYLSPLRALGYDVEHNVRRPLREMALLERPNSERAQLRRGRIRERFVRTGVRTSDTPPEERRLMMARPPHLLMTTPESLALMLAMESYRKFLGSVETVIVDEIHALAANKRGAYLSLCLETLDTIAKVPPVRIGLSATIEPLEEVARFLVGERRECAIVDKRGLRAITLGIMAPFSGAMAPMAKIAQAAVDLGRDVRTQLVFTNVRSQAERLAHEMALLEGAEVDVLGEDAKPRPRTDSKIGIHHSALERSVRHRVEERLRQGTLHTVVCSSSLELGVDIGHIDRVCIHGGARGVTATLQRVGRAGHRPDAVADGVVIAQDRDDILEAAATRSCIGQSTIEKLQIPSAPLDVLAQWLVLNCCPERRLPLGEALALARRAAPFADLSEDDLRQCALYLSGGGAGPDEAHVRRIGFERETLFGLGREASSAFFENVGTIPDESGIVVSARGAKIGRVEEDFVSSLRVGDVFLLSGTAYKVREIRGSGIDVEHVQARPNVPQWSSHIKGVPVVLAREVAALRYGIAQRLGGGGPQAAFAWLAQRYALDGAEAAHAVRYIAQQMAVSLVSAPDEAFVEIYRIDRSQTAIFHTCAGRRANETLARIVAARLLCEAKLDSHLTTDDNGFLVTLPPNRKLPDALWASLLHVQDFERDLLEGLRASHLLRRHFRYVANTGLLVLRRAGGHTLRRGALRWNSERIFDRLYAADPSFPLIRETIRVVTRDLLDAPAALAYLQGLVGEPRVVHPPAASPFSFGIVTSSFGDSVVMDDRASMVEALHERVLAMLGEHKPAQDQPDEAAPSLFPIRASR